MSIPTPTQPANAHTVMSSLSPAIVAVAGKTTNQTLTWTNNLGVPIFIYKGYIWCGVSKGCEGDISLWLVDPRENYKVTNDDHYEDRGAIGANEVDFDASPAYFYLMPGEQVTLLATVNADCGVNCVAQAFFFLYYVV